MTKNIFFIYIVFSMVISLIAVETQLIHIPFDYEQEFDTSELLSYQLYLWWACLCFYFGNRITKIKKKPINVELITAKVNTGLGSKYIIFMQLLIVFYFLSKVDSAFELSSEFTYITNYRPFGDKFSVILLLIQGVLPVLAIKNKATRIFTILISVLLSLVFAWIDASRASILPLSGMLLSSLTKKNMFLFIPVLLLMILNFVTAMAARSVYDRLHFSSILDVFQILSENFTDLLISLISYFTAFSITQFAYVTREYSGVFTSFDLFYSVIPIPSFMWPSRPDMMLWRVDRFRPMGAVSELLRVSFFFFSLFFVFYGYLSKKLDNISNINLKILSACIFALTCVSIFQYNLRSVQWFLYFMFIITIFDNVLYRVNKIS